MCSLYIRYTGNQYVEYIEAMIQSYKGLATQDLALTDCLKTPQTVSESAKGIVSFTRQ